MYRKASEHYLNRSSTQAPNLQNVVLSVCNNNLNFQIDGWVMKCFGQYLCLEFILVFLRSNRTWNSSPTLFQPQISASNLWDSCLIHPEIRDGSFVVMVFTQQVFFYFKNSINVTRWHTITVGRFAPFARTDLSICIRQSCHLGGTASGGLALC